MFKDEPMKVQVKWPKLRIKNALLSQFLTYPHTDGTNVSSVWNTSSEVDNLNTHLESNHEERKNREEDSDEKLHTSLQVIPSQAWVLPTPRSSRDSNATTFGSPSVVPCQVLSHSGASVGINVTFETSIDDLSSVVFPLVSLQLSLVDLQVLWRLATSDDSNFTIKTVRIFRDWPLPGPRLQWQIAWYEQF